MGDIDQTVIKRIIAVIAQILATAIPLLILFINSYSNLYEKIIILENDQSGAKGIPCSKVRGLQYSLPPMMVVRMGIKINNKQEQKKFS